MSNQRDQEQCCCPIQRLAIIHMQLAQLSGRGYLDENASFEESSEQILYYYDDALKNATGNASASQDTLLGPVRYQIPQAVQFVGLCTALLTLPASMDSEQEEESTDATEFVYLQKSLLIFITLESSPLVVAVVQVGRVNNTYDSDERVGCGGCPGAIKASIQQSYRLFQLLRRGGIHSRLLHSKNASSEENERFASSDANSTECVYPGMKRLFELRKRVRKACDQNKNPDIEIKVPDQEIREMEREIEELQISLPITALRSDLSVHFNDLMEEMTLAGTYSTRSVKHCLVDTLPTPTALVSGSHRTSSVPHPPNMELLDPLLGTTRQLIDAENQHWAPDEPFLLGVSIFLSGQLICTIYASSNSSEQALGNFDVPLTTAYLIMQYIASYRYKIMIHHHHGNHLAPASPPRFQRLPLPFESTDGPSGDDHDSVVRGEAYQTRLGQFLSPPPLSMLSATDHVHDVQGPQGERIWAPRISLPQHDTGVTTTESSTVTEVHVIVYEVKDLSFLLYFTPDAVFTQDTNAQGDLATPTLFPPVSLQKFSAKLETISRQLSDCVEQLTMDRKPEASDTSQASDSVDPSPFTTSVLEWKEPGQDIIFVDRASNQILLFSDRLSESSVNENKKVQRSPSRSPTRSFLSRLKGKKSQRTPARDRKSSTDGSTLDCRHILASLLPHESLQALDDVIREVQDRSEHGGDSHEEAWEAATFTAHGWVYARTLGAKELYVLLDSSVYMTVADVQQAVSRIRSELLNDVL